MNCGPGFDLTQRRIDTKIDTSAAHDQRHLGHGRTEQGTGVAGVGWRAWIRGSFPFSVQGLPPEFDEFNST